MRSILPITALLAIIKLLAQPAGAPGNVRSWDLVTYTVPPGFKLSEEKAGDGARARAVLSNAGTSGCLIAIHTSSPAGNSLTASFTAEWQAIGANSSPAPQPTVRAAGNTRAAVGKLASDSGEQLMLLVLDAGTRVISVLVVSSTKEVFDVCIPHLAALLSSMEVASVRRPSNSSAAPVFSRPRIVDGKLVIPPLSRVLTAADLSGEWGQNSSFTTRYVDRA